MPLTESDPRVFFAAERTFLAWLRTGITIMALGFVVSRFGLFVQLLTIQSSVGLNAAHSTFSGMLGVAFVIVGTLVIIVASLQHQRYIATLPECDLPNAYSKRFAVLLSTLVVALGIILTIYLILTQS